MEGSKGRNLLTVPSRVPLIPPAQEVGAGPLKPSFGSSGALCRSNPAVPRGPKRFQRAAAGMRRPPMQKASTFEAFCKTGST